MTNYIEISAGYPGKPVARQGRWQRYLLFGLATNVAFWSSAFLYLKVTPPTYTSYSAINLLGAGSNANVCYVLQNQKLCNVELSCTL